MRVVSILVCGLLVACGGRQSPMTSEPIDSVESEDVENAINVAFSAYKSAYENHSLSELSALYHQDLDVGLVFQGRRYTGFTQVSGFLSKRLENVTMVRMTVSDLTVQTLGAKSAIAHAVIEATIGDDAVSVTEKGALSLVYQKVGAQWRIVFEHFSYPPSR